MEKTPYCVEAWKLNQELFENRMQLIAEVYGVEFDDKKMAAWYKIFQHIDGTRFEAGVKYLFSNATSPAPKWIFEGIAKAYPNTSESGNYVP